MRVIKTAIFIVLLTATAGWAHAQIEIFDIQFIDTNGGSDVSPWLGQTVSISGVVTSSRSADNLGVVHIQQPGLTEWAGIELRDGVGLSGVAVGDFVTATGNVAEFSGKTVIGFVTSLTVTGTGSIEPLELDPSVFTSYSLTGNEKYEGMLVRLLNPGNNVSVVDKNPDAPNNFGEWRVGSAPGSPGIGCRVLTGVSTSSTQSSLNVSWVNSLNWASQSGSMNVPAIEVNDGDEFQSITGVITYQFGDMKLLPRNNADVIVPDLDGDGIDDVVDNCTVVANTQQVDADGDGIGNACDADFNNDCIVNALDLGLFKQAFFSTQALFDINGDGVVNALDLGLLKLAFFVPPGPSATDLLCN